MTTKQKQLSVASINKHHTDEFGAQKKVTLSNGDFFLMSSKFKPTSIQRLIADYIDLVEQLKGKGANLEVVRNITFILPMLIIKHFTNITIPVDIEKMIIVCEKLIDLNILEEIIANFDQNEIEKIDEMIKKVESNSKLIGNQIGELFVQAELNDQTEDEVSA